MNKYLDLIKKTTTYATKMNRLSRQIFGEVVRDTNESSMQVVKRLSEKPFYTQDEVVNYYPRHKETHQLMMKLRSYGLYRDEHEDFKEEMRRVRKLRGKGPPKKGEGKNKLKGK